MLMVPKLLYNKNNKTFSLKRVPPQEPTQIALTRPIFATNGEHYGYAQYVCNP